MATARPLPPTAELEARVEMIIHECERAINNRDLDKLISYYTPDAVVMAPSRPMATGLNAIRQLYHEFMDIGVKAFKTHIERIVPSNEFIIATGTYTLDFKTPKTAEITDRGKFVGIYQLLKNGDCKVLFDIWNSDLPPFMPPK
jgi:ketosteroid isomerase-like protein